MVITKIVIDLGEWEEHYPTGCVLYNNDEVVDSEFCDNAEEYIEFIDRYKDFYVQYLTEVRVVFDAYSLDNETAMECAKEVWEHIHGLIYGNN